jgi:hypothetical protein
MIEAASGSAPSTSVSLSINARDVVTRSSWCIGRAGPTDVAIARSNASKVNKWMAGERSEVQSKLFKCAKHFPFCLAFLLFFSIVLSEEGHSSVAALYSTKVSFGMLLAQNRKILTTLLPCV